MTLSCDQILQAAKLQPGRRSGDELLFTCPRHDDKHPSLTINISKNVWMCGPCGASGTPWALAAFLAKTDPENKTAVMDWLRRHGLVNGDPRVLRPPSHWKGKPVTAWYSYTDTSGTELYRVARVECQTEKGKHKEFPVWCNGHWGLNGSRRVLYRLPRLAKADHVFIVEGEKDVHTLESCGLTATTNPMGAGKWLAEYAESFTPQQSVTIIPDNDEPGKAHALTVARSLLGKVGSVKILDLPGVPPKGDVSDWFQQRTGQGKSAEAIAEELCNLDDGANEFSTTKSLPKVRPWVDIAVPEHDDSVLIGPGRWLTVGSGCFVIGPTGIGKSTLTGTLSYAWGLGRTSLGFRPTKPLRSLIVQAEDDDGDLADMRAGIFSALAPSDAEVGILKKHVLVVTERAATGVKFLNDLVRPLLKELKPDLLWMNPLSAYFGDDLNDQEAVACFFRNNLNPILAEHHCAAMVIHHTAKPNKERRDWSGGELAYLGAGSGDLANWSRETITLRQTKPGLFELTCTKRWRKLDWRDADGKPTATRLIAHGSNGSMFWRDADGDILSELGTEFYSDSAMLRLVPDEGMDKAVLIKNVSTTFAVSERQAARYVRDACRALKRMVKGKLEAVQLLKTTEKPRKTVYPDEPGNRPVVWVTRS